MVFCSQCGSQVSDDSKFCNNCGAKINFAQQEQASNADTDKVYDGKIHICPKCKAETKAFSGKCEYCDYVFRDAKSSDATSDFSAAIENVKHTLSDSDKSVGRSLADLFADELLISSGTKQEISVIRSYPIPNTKEDILEFMILSSTNIDPAVYAGSAQQVSQVEIAKAWYSKFLQAYEKAKIVFPDEPEFSTVEKIYQDKQAAIRSAKIHRNILLWGLLSFICILLVILLILL